MRVGNNPLRGQAAPVKMPEVVATVLTHLPDQTGYHEQRLTIVKACLTSMRRNMGMDAPVYVWDNGSCEALREWLVHEYKPDWLILSGNIGKPNVKASKLRMFPPETLMAMSDDDMLFYPDWLVKQVELFRHFQNVGVVTGYPCRFMFRINSDATKNWAKENARLQIGHFIPDEWEEDYGVSVGMDGDSWIAQSKVLYDALITYKGKQAYATGHHCQCLAQVGRVTQFSMWMDKALTAEEIIWDQSIDKAGMLRLATTERLCRHMGNRIDKKLQRELEEMKLLDL